MADDYDGYSDASLDASPQGDTRVRRPPWNNLHVGLKLDHAGEGRRGGKRTPIAGM
jgi:hypothetical protein